MMIAVERLTRILRVLAASDHVLPHHARLSAILIAPSDAGKSELILSHLPAGARVLDDFTSASLYHLLKDPPRPSWIVVPDLNALISHKPSVANLTMANLLSLLAEGTSEIMGPDGAKMKLRDTEPNGIRLGLLTGITPEMFFARRGKWRATGFLRRLIPLYYTYSTETQQAIQSAIRGGHDATPYHRASMPGLAGPLRAVAIPRTIGRAISDMSESSIRYNLRWGSLTDETRNVRAFELPFSVHKTFRRYARAHARLARRKIVTAPDLAALEDFARFVRYDQPEIL